MESLAQITAVSNRFWSKVEISDPDQCWEWTGYIDPSGYGRFSIEGSPHYAHRVVKILEGLDIAGRVVRHSCDNPPCCNPHHLLIGTHADNVADRTRRGRHWTTSGEEHPNSKLKTAQVVAIRSEFLSLPRCKSGMVYKGRFRTLSKKYGISPSNLRCIVSGKTWQHCLEEK